MEYGYRRVKILLHDQEYLLNNKHILRIMRQDALLISRRSTLDVISSQGTLLSKHRDTIIHVDQEFHYQTQFLLTR